MRIQQRQKKFCDNITENKVEKETTPEGLTSAGDRSRI